MTIFYRTVLTLGGLLLIFMGSQFLIDPVGAGADFGLQVEGAHGLTSVRADFTSFFTVAGACLIWGAWAKRRDPLLIGAALMLVTLAARLIGLAVDGSFDGFIPPIVVEGVLGLTALGAARAWRDNQTVQPTMPE